MNSGIYILEFDNGIKIGTSIQVRTRLKTYKNPWCKEIKQFNIFPCVNPHIIEKLLLNHFKNRLHSETSKEFFLNVSFKEASDKAVEILKQNQDVNILSDDKNNNLYKFIFSNHGIFFSTKDFALELHKSISTASHRLRVLERTGMVQEVTRGIWANINHPNLNMLGVTPYLLGVEHGYVSFFSALQFRGVIKNIQNNIQIATTGHSRNLTTPIGNFDFFQLNPKMVNGHIDFTNDKCPYRIATIEKAILDILYLSTRRVNRFASFNPNTIYFDKEKLLKIMKEQIEHKSIKNAILSKLQ
jgi:hypothetical protein